MYRELVSRNIECECMHFYNIIMIKRVRMQILNLLSNKFSYIYTHTQSNKSQIQRHDDLHNVLSNRIQNIIHFSKKTTMSIVQYFESWHTKRAFYLASLRLHFSLLRFQFKINLKKRELRALGKSLQYEALDSARLSHRFVFIAILISGIFSFTIISTNRFNFFFFFYWLHISSWHSVKLGLTVFSSWDV
jgi:hypothetical protein